MKTNHIPNSIYGKSNPELAAFFHSAGDPRKVLCVALDFAKQKHVALICDGTGSILKQAFPVHNNPAGFKYLIEEVLKTASRRKIPKTQVIFGGEDKPSYALNFLQALENGGWKLAYVNAWRAKKLREGQLASTDSLDLRSISELIISCRATFVNGGPAAQDYLHIRGLMRQRRTLTKQLTANSNRIHTLVDQLLPGFLDYSKSGVTPFSQASLELMSKRFSSTQIARRKPASLADMLARFRIHQPEETAAKVIALAAGCLPADAGQLPGLQSLLESAVSLHRCLEDNAQAFKNQAALALATTPYVMLTSIQGIGPVLAAGAAGELGETSKLPGVDRLCSYAGIVPKTSQSGGPDKPATQGRLSPHCNHILKDWVMQATNQIRMAGPPELKERIERWELNGQHALHAGAKRYLRLLRALVLNHVPYLPPLARTSGASHQHREAAAWQTWEQLCEKWRMIPGGLQLIHDEAYPIGFWRRVMKEAWNIRLPSRVC